MNDPIFILSYVVFFAGLGLIVWWTTTLDRRPASKDHPAPGE